MGDNYVKKWSKLCVAMGPLQKRYPLLNVHVYFAKACRCRVTIPKASKLAETVASDGTPSKQPSSFRHVTSLDGRTCGSLNDFLIFTRTWGDDLM